MNMTNLAEPNVARIVRHFPVASCERCAAELDAERAFVCPRCAGTARSTTEGARLVCAACGPLDDVEAAPLFAAEARWRPWARQRPWFHVLADSGLEGADLGGDTAECALREAERQGLGEAHWIVDALVATAAEESSTERCQFLRRRVRVHAAAGPHAVTRCLRLQVDLGKALRPQRDDVELLREQITLFGAAAETLAVLFGDDHPEHLEAAELQEGASGAATARSGSSIGLPVTATTKMGGYPANDKRPQGKRRR